MIVEISRYQTARGRLPDRVRRTLDSKVELLAANPSHPGLRTHRLRNIAASECYVSRGLRLIFRYQGVDLVLLDVGRHALIDRMRRKTG